MKILCYINHFFGKNPQFLGKSSLPSETSVEELKKKGERRKEYVSKVIANMKSIGDIDVKVCGIEGFSLVPLDICFNSIREKPLWMIYESLNHMAQYIDQYDYFINVEDDILIPEQTIQNIIAFDQVSMINEIFLPNRLERSLTGDLYCVDLLSIKEWTQQRKQFQDHALRVAANPHSGLAIFSREKFKYALRAIDPAFRKAILYNELDSAFAYFHSPFSLFRSEDLNFHSVIHLDKWSYSPGEAEDSNTWKKKFGRLRWTDFVPPVILSGCRVVARSLGAKI